MRSHFILCGLAIAGLILLAASAVAQQNPAVEIAGYEGADRQQRLIEGARKEKELTFYSSIPPQDIAAMAAAFDKKYGIKVRVWRADSEGFLQRILNEAKARRFEVDIAAGSTSAMEPLYRENLLQQVKSPYLLDLRPGTVAPHGHWAAVYLSVFVQAFNTNLVNRDALPKTFADLARPEWKGKLAVEADDFDWFAEIVRDLGEAQGLRLFRDIVAANGISVRKGHSLLNNLIAAGEVPLALSGYGFLAEQAKRHGAPIDWFVLPPTIARATAQGLARNAAHPYAAVLFYDFLISDAQQILAARDFVPASSKIDNPFAHQTIRIIDSAQMLDQSRKWQELFQKTIIAPSR